MPTYIQGAYYIHLHVASLYLIIQEHVASLYLAHNTMSYNRVSGDAQTAHCPTSSDTTHTGALSRYLASRILTVS